MAHEAAIGPLPANHTKLSRQQLTGFWGAWAGWTLDGMDSVIYAFVLSPALTELLPKSGVKATLANVGFAGSILFALFLVGWGLSFVWGPIADKFGRTQVLCWNDLRVCPLHGSGRFVPDGVAISIVPLAGGHWNWR
jgi:MFS family permease